MEENNLICGVDEVGRGPLCGPVVSAAVVLPNGFTDSRIKDSKKIKSSKKMKEIADFIKENAISYSIGISTAKEIDDINILQSTYLAMHRAIKGLTVVPNKLLIDGNSFKPYEQIPYECVIKGDDKHIEIAAASIIAKNYRDEMMVELSKEYPDYKWESNSGYGTKDHIEAIKRVGLTPHHRLTFCTKFKN
jgi:ribonuclease HII